MTQGLLLSSPLLRPAFLEKHLRKIGLPDNRYCVLDCHEEVAIPEIQILVQLPALKLVHNTRVVAWQLQSQLHTNVKTPEQEAALRSIRKLIEFWRISPEELEFEASIVPSVLPEVVAPSPKYRHPMSGETWDGQGTQPQWLRDALTRGGYTVEELRCTSPESLRLEH